MVVQTTFPVPSVIDAQRRTSQPLHQVTPPWPRTTTRKSLPVNNDSTPEQWRLDFQSTRDGRFARLVASSCVSHVKGQWRLASDQGLPRHHYFNVNMYVDREVASCHIWVITSLDILPLRNPLSLVRLASSPVRH